MKFSNCFLLNALVYLTLASVALPGKECSMYSSSTNTKTTGIVQKVKAESIKQEDIKNDLLFRF